MIALSTHDKANLNGDLIEERQDGIIYIGLFRNGTNETHENNCLIRRITTLHDEATGFTITKTEYPEGVNFDFRYSWSERENYNYKYNKSK